MNRVILSLQIVFTLCLASVGLGQKLTADKLAEMNVKAKWVQIALNEDDNPIFIDSVMIDRVQDVVFLRTKSEMRGTTKYYSFMGGCDNNALMQFNGFAVYPGSPRLVPLDDDSKDSVVVKKGTIGYRLLDYACKNAKVTVVETAPKPGPKTVSGGVLNGNAMYLPKPVYPPAARAARVGGTVSVQVLIDEEGNVISATAISGHQLLNSAAEAAAHKAKFSPTLVDGRSVKVSGVITYTFVP